jgi:hypothetical protein
MPVCYTSIQIREIIEQNCLHLEIINSPLFIEGNFYDTEYKKNCYVVLKKTIAGFVLFYYNDIYTDQWYNCKNLIALNFYELGNLYALSMLVYHRL